jgi:predicted transcriptional regulator YdeE
MEKIKIDNDLTVMGITVTDFPNGIGKTFDKLVKEIPGGFDRPYYGISRMTPNGFHYLAAALEKYDGEALKHNYERDKVEKGEYLVMPLENWRSKTDMIKDIFTKMMDDPNADTSKPCVEWYKDEKVMLCMVRMKTAS